MQIFEKSLWQFSRKFAKVLQNSGKSFDILLLSGKSLKILQASGRLPNFRGGEDRERHAPRGQAAPLGAEHRHLARGPEPGLRRYAPRLPLREVPRQPFFFLFFRRR